MKILLTTGIFKPEVGGPATFAAEFAERMHRLGHQVTVITYSDTAAFSGDSAFSFPIIRVIRKNKLSNYIRYFSAVLKAAPAHDLIYTLDWFSAGVPVSLAALLLRKKYIVRVGGGYIWEKYLSEGRPPVTLRAFYDKGLYKDYSLMFWLISRVLRGATVVIFNSQAQKDLYGRYYNLQPEKMKVIRNAVSSEHFSGIREKNKEIVFAGRFIKMKNVESAVRAFAQLADHSFKLVLIGDGPTESLLHGLVTELNLEDRVEFVPRLSQEDLRTRIIHAYYFILPSWTDISPHQVYECRTLGIPVLLTKENYLDLHIPEKYLIDPASISDIAQKMNMFLSPQEYDEFVKAQVGITPPHSWDDVLAIHMNIFKSLS